MNERDTVSLEAESRFLNHPERTIWTEFLWFADDPLAVILIFGGEQQWELSRDLLIDGQYVLTGEGDVRVGPMEYGLDLYLLLRSPDGTAELELDGGAVSEFLAQTCEIVPLGSECYEITADDLREMEGKGWRRHQ